MAGTFATDEMQGALKDVSNGVAVKNDDAVMGGDAFKNGDAVIKATTRPNGWAEPSRYDYVEYGKDPKDIKEPTAMDEHALAWGHNAQKYEWKEEYGEVGPRNEELEQMLYHSEFITRQGIKFDE
jgi:ATP-dependent RNA helicase DDX3X